MRILLTGTSGFVGGHLALALADAHQVAGSHFRHDCAAEVRAACSAFFRGDLADGPHVRQFLRDFMPEAVIHCAAIASVQQCENDPLQAEHSNILASETLLRACASLPQPPLLIYLSSDLVFDGRSPKHGGFSENDDPAPCTVYSRTKRQSELLAGAYAGPKSVFRICLVYGPKIGEQEGTLGWIAGLCREGKTVPLFSDEWRTPVYSGDIALASAAALRLHQEGRSAELPAVVHIGGPERVSRHGFGLLAAEVFGWRRCLIEKRSRLDFPGAVPRAEDVSLRISLLRKHLGIEPLACRPGLEACAKAA